MRNLLASVLLVAVLLAGAVPSLAADSGSRLTRSQISQLLDGRLFALEDASVATESGHLFLLGRDRKTRRLEWFLVDPARARVVRRGQVPFQVYRTYAVAPDGRTAVVHARYPSSLWTLSLEDGGWTRVRANDNPDRLVLTALSGLLYTDAGHAASILDLLDAGRYVTDSVMVRFATRPFAITDRASLQELQARAREALPADVSTGADFGVDLMRYGRDGSFVFVLQSHEPPERGGRTLCYLFRRDPRGNLKLLDQGEGTLIPLDFEASTDRVLYRTVDGGRPALALLTQGRKRILARRPTVAAALLGPDRVAAITLVGHQLEISAGPVGEELRKIETVKGVYRASFLRDGRRLLLWNDQDVRTVQLGP